jgi:K+-sensing histidine kinase KdpD
MAQVSHEIRTPLNAVIGFSDVMTAEIFGPVGHPRYREYVDHIRESGRALLKSAEDTLALTQLLAEPGAPAQAPIALDLRGVLSESWSYHAGAARLRSVTLALDIEPCIELLGDRRLINPIFLNLFAEAIARAGDGARVTLSAHADGDLAAIEIALDRAQSLRAPGEASLPLSLARALRELQDAFLVELPAGPGAWKAATMMARATQQDFFADRRAAALETAYAS